MISWVLRNATLVCLFFAWSAGEAQAERRVALVIGNSAYQNVTPLPNPVKDAAAIAAMLERAHFDVVESRADLTNINLRRALREFARKALDADIAVVYYAGHGIEVDGTNYLIPVDAKLNSDLDVYDEAIPLDRIINLLEPVRRLRLVILDACRENPFVKKMTRTIAVRAIRGGLAKIEVTTTDTLVAFAAKAGMTAEDGKGEHSPFTTALLDNLTVPGLDLRLALGRVRDEVIRNTNNKQEPYVYGSLGGATVALVPKPAPPAAAAKPAAPPARLVVRDYEFAERIGTREAWDYFLAAHKTGLYANLARAARDKLIAAQARQRRDSAGAAAEAQPAAAMKPAENAAREAKPAAAAQAPPAPTVVANAPAATDAESANQETRPETDPVDIARRLQAQLKRVGCDPGSVDGKWAKRSAHALRQFNRHAHASLDVKVASLAALETVKQHKERVCPLECGKGFKARGDRCVAEACRRGYVRNKAGHCERRARRVQARPARQEKKGGSRPIFCGRAGCRAVPKGCSVVYTTDGLTRLSC